MTQSDGSHPTWQRARLIPVSGLKGAEDQERRATSALMAVLSAVDEFGQSFTKQFGAHKGEVETFIEVPFELSEGVTVIPDGLIRVTRGKRVWTALVEVKTGRNELNRDQIENYLEAARGQGFDCVITISNQIPRVPGEHPVTVNRAKLRKVSLHHISWSRVLTEAVMEKAHRGIADPDQAWILGELIRYLEHPNAGSLDFDDMGEHWVAVRDAAISGTLRVTDKKAPEIASRWEELVTFVALRLGRELGTDVQEVLSRRELAEPGLRISSVVKTMCTSGILDGRIRIPGAIGDIELQADLRAQRIITSVSFPAPSEGRPKTRVNWLMRQLKKSPSNVRVDCFGVRSKQSMSDLLEKVRMKPEVLLPVDGRDIGSFEVAISRPMGLKRSGSKKSFVSTIVETVDEFYADVVQHLAKWQAAAPKLTRSVPEELSSDRQEPQEVGEGEPQDQPQDLPAPIWPSAGTWKSE